LAGTTNYRYRPFGSFRLFLAFLVVLQHFIANAGPLGPIYDYFLPYGMGSLAVLVFFCLSGFVIAEAATQVYPDKPAAYLANRFLRIVPHYIVALATAVAILAAFDTWGTLRFPELGHPDMASLHAFDWSNIAANSSCWSRTAGGCRHWPRMRWSLSGWQPPLSRGSSAMVSSFFSARFCMTTAGIR